jgi:5-methylcytosine-specific restriction protein A
MKLPPDLRYNSTRWRHLRRQVLLDEPICRICKLNGMIRASVVADHIKPHNGDPALFWDRANLQGICEPHHNSKNNEDKKKVNYFERFKNGKTGT